MTLSDKSKQSPCRSVDLEPERYDVDSKPQAE